MKAIVGSVVLCAAAAIAGINAQSGTEMKDVSYSGCLAAGKTPKTYVLTHASATDDHMSKDAMRADSMAKDAMAKPMTEPATLLVSSQSVDLSKHVGHQVAVTGTTAHAAGAMGKDAMGKDAMAKDAMARDDMGKEPATGPAVTIKTLKVLASSCK